MFGVLLEQGHHLRVCVDQRVCFLIDARFVLAQPNQELHVTVAAEYLASLASCRTMLMSDDVAHDPADAGQRVNGGIVSAFRELSGKQDMPIQQRDGFFADGVGLKFSLQEHRVKSGD